MQYRLIPLAEKTAWEEALTDIPHAYAHTHWYNSAMHIASGRDIFLYAAEANNFRVVCPISPRQKTPADPCDITTPYGFSGFASIGQYDNFSALWHAHMHEEHYVCGHIALNPRLSVSHLYAEKNCFAGKKSYYLDVSPPLENILQGFAHGHRYDLKQWQKKNYVIAVNKNPELIQKFVTLYAEFAQRKQAAQVYHFNQASWDIILQSSDSTLISVLNEGELEAAAVFIWHENIGDYFIAASTLGGQIHSKAIIWEAIKLAKETNATWLHLGCGVKANDALEQFKARFGAKSQDTFALKAIYDMVSYQALCNKYGTNSKQLDGYFPSYWNAHSTLEGN